MAKIKSFNRDDCLDLSLVYILFEKGGKDVIDKLRQKKIIIDCANNEIRIEKERIRMEEDATYKYGDEFETLSYEDLLKKLLL